MLGLEEFTDGKTGELNVSKCFASVYTRAGAQTKMSQREREYFDRVLKVMEKAV